MAVAIHINLYVPRPMYREIEAIVRTRYVSRSEAVRRLLTLGLEAERREFGPVEVEPEPIRLKGAG